MLLAAAAATATAVISERKNTLQLNKREKQKS